MTKFPKVSKALHVAKSEGLTANTAKAIAGILVAGSLAVAIPAEAHVHAATTLENSVAVNLSPAGRVMLLAPSAAEDPLKTTQHYSHSSHASHASHYSHYSSR